MSKYIKKFNKHSEYGDFILTDDFIRPNVSYCKLEEEVHYSPILPDYSKKYLTFVALEDGSEFSFNPVSSNTISYSVDDGETWTTLASGASTPSIDSGDKIMWKGEMTPYANMQQQLVGVGSFTSTKTFDVEGNAMSLLYGDEFKGENSLEGKDWAFALLFMGADKLINAKKLCLPATTLADYCYISMFGACTSLTTVPQLPATTLANYCYGSMFGLCTSLTTAPELPATTLASACYAQMFYGCTSLTTAPELTATTLAESCYNEMFQGCTSLTSTPELPATTLASFCYSSMFEDCTSLTTAPQLPATTLAESCYAEMFKGCTSLTTAPQLPATTLAQGCYQGMFRKTGLTTAPQLPATTLAASAYTYMFWDCTSLTTAPELPATTLAEYCYDGMFNICTNLTAAPQLPATTLARSCYGSMFAGCTSLTTAPELPAATLASACYSHMFYGCTNLNSVTCLATDITASNCTTSWLGGVASSGTFTKADSMTSWTTGDSGIPTGWTMGDVIPEGEDDIQYNNYDEYLTFEATQSGTFTLTIPDSVDTNYVTSVSYSIDNGTTWTTVQNSSSSVSVTTPTIQAGAKVLWKGTANAYSLGTSSGQYSIFSSTGNFKATGNIMSLLYGDNFINSYHEFPTNSIYTFCYLFRECWRMTTAPLLPATTLSERCYQYMFYGCSGLIHTPHLPAMTLASTCYAYMFYNCSRITDAGDLPATTLADTCYYGMFRGCTNLVTSPTLPATTLVTNCYSNMFYGCSKLNSITAMFTTEPGTTYTQNWVNGVASTGTFVKNSAAAWTTTGVDGIPSGWTVVDASA